MARGIALWLAALALMVGGKAAAAELALKRVMLSTGGIGYFEYEARVEGDAAVSIDVPLDQVDDVLKSLVVYDSAGSAGEITLPGREPLQQSFADLPFNRDALQSAIDLLNALQGAEIRVAAPRAISGRLVHVDQESIAGPGGVAETRPRVSVMTEQGLQQFPLHDADAINFADPKLQAQVATALERIAAYRDTGRRRLTLQLHGNGGRSVRVGYVVAAPLWKPTYRLSVDADPKAGTARLQGWAVLENFSGTAWHGVELTLLSGNPVTFRQALYESYYVPRQTVPVESGTHVLPPPDQGAIAMQAEAKPSASPPAQRYKPVGEPAPAAAAPAPPAGIEPAGAIEEATQIAFTTPYPVDVAAGQSLVLPLLDRQLPVRRIDSLDGWCEEPSDRRYNRAIRISPGQPGDRLWRSDALYDLIIEIDHNQRPRVSGRGSAVFIHVARADLSPTAGCISLPISALRKVIARLGPRTRLTIHC